VYVSCTFIIIPMCHCVWCVCVCACGAAMKATSLEHCLARATRTYRWSQATPIVLLLDYSIVRSGLDL
jgi:hypothetical protein